MSFFVDFFNEFNVNDNEIRVSIILGKFLYLCGKFKVLDFNDLFVYLLIRYIFKRLIISLIEYKESLLSG